MAKSTLFPEIDAPIRFFADMAPVPQPRQRHAYSKGLGRVINYLPKDHPIHQFKQLVAARAKQSYQGPPLKGPLEMFILFLLKRPAGMKELGRTWCDVRVGDIDNFVKAVLDGLNKITYEDDSQICQLTTRKLYAGADEEPGVEVMIQELV